MEGMKAHQHANWSIKDAVISADVHMHPPF